MNKEVIQYIQYINSEQPNYNHPPCAKMEFVNPTISVLIIKDNSDFFLQNVSFAPIYTKVPTTPDDHWTEMIRVYLTNLSGVQKARVFTRNSKVVNLLKKRILSFFGSFLNKTSNSLIRIINSHRATNLNVFRFLSKAKLYYDMNFIRFDFHQYNYYLRLNLHLRLEHFLRIQINNSAIEQNAVLLKLCFLLF